MAALEGQTGDMRRGIIMDVAWASCPDPLRSQRRAIEGSKANNTQAFLTPHAVGVAAVSWFEPHSACSSFMFSARLQG